MGILRLETDKGPIIVGIDTKGVSLGFVPQIPSEDGVNDIWTTGLRFSSIAKGLHCLKGGPRFTTKGFRMSLHRDAARLEFEFTHRPGKYFEVELDGEATDQLRQYLASVLAGGSGVGDNEQSPTVQSHGKVGRNDPCPCGSGRKYKRCCLDQKAAIASIDPLSFVRQTGDPYVNDLLADTLAHPEAIQDSSFWMDLGTACGVSGNHEAALTAFRHAETLEPEDGAVKVNIAAIQEILGNYDEAFATLANAPASARRKAIVTGNLLQGLERDAEAIPYFEQAAFRRGDRKIA